MLASGRLGVMGLPVDLASTVSAVDQDPSDRAGETGSEAGLDDRTRALDDAFGVSSSDERRYVPTF
ncbi:MAG TPA: hypothetical protein VHJ20_01295 [Polyangia bacterium]|nr:hypothetical protein [Polyangia bacterium]